MHTILSENLNGRDYLGGIGVSVGENIRADLKWCVRIWTGFS